MVHILLLLSFFFFFLITLIFQPVNFAVCLSVWDKDGREIILITKLITLDGFLSTHTLASLLSLTDGLVVTGSISEDF